MGLEFLDVRTYYLGMSNATSKALRVHVTFDMTHMVQDQWVVRRLEDGIPVDRTRLMGKTACQRMLRTLRAQPAPIMYSADLIIETPSGLYAGPGRWTENELEAIGHSSRAQALARGLEGAIIRRRNP